MLATIILFQAMTRLAMYTPSNTISFKGYGMNKALFSLYLNVG